MSTQQQAMNIPAQLVKQLRERTNAGFADCRAALVEAGGDIEKAISILRKKGQAAAAKKASREASEGLVGSYIHAGGKIGVLVEVNCESDFVARTEAFQQLCHDIAMHIAALDPRYVRRDEVTPEMLEKEREIYRAQALATGKPEAVVERIVNGKILRGDVPGRAALHQGRRRHDQRNGEQRDRQAGRKHHHPALRALQSRRDSRRLRYTGAGARSASLRHLGCPANESSSLPVTAAWGFLFLEP
jgi:hypothetical protein